MSGPGRMFFGDEEWANVQAAMSGTLTRYRYGPPGDPTFVHRFEREAETFFGSRRCIAMNSCTSTLLTALGALGVGPGDEVIVPGYTFVASIAAVVFAGATPVLAEIDDTLNLDPADVAARITPRTRGVIAVHMLGAGAELERLGAITRDRGLFLLEDVAQSCGGSQGGRRLGSIGTCGTFSLNYFKVITSGEGGFLLSNDEAFYRRAYGLHDHGFAPLRDGVVDDDVTFGLNLRMSDLTGALALAQLGKLDTVLARTRSIKAKLVSAIGELPGVTRRRLVDEAGDCGTSLAYIFPDESAAAEVAALLGTSTLRQSGRHYYGNMGQLKTLERVGGSRPFRGLDPDNTRDYSAGALPATDSVLARTVTLATGSTDQYAATGFGLDVHCDDAQIEAVAATFRDAVAKVAG